MSGFYRPGWESKTYRHYPRISRADIAREVDQLFRAKTGIARKLHPTSREDLESRRIWLRIRDEVVARREAKLDEDWYKPGGPADQIAADRKDSLLTGIPDEMRWEHWNEAAELLETWFERPPAIAPQYSAPVTNVVKIDWVLQFPRAKEVFDDILNNKIWIPTNAKMMERWVKVLKTKPPAGGTFGDLGRPVPEIDEAWVNSRPVTPGKALDGLTAALGNFHLQVAITARVSRTPTGSLILAIDEIGIYAKDSVDFNGSQFLGLWGPHDDPVYNADFEKWRKDHNLGGDFQVFSDVKRIRRNPPDVVVVSP